MTNDEGMTKINLRTLSESNDEKLSSLNVGIFSGFVIQACFDIRHSGFVISLNRFVSPKLSERGVTQRLGACIISTAIMLPRNTSSTIPRPTKMALRNGSF